MVFNCPFIFSGSAQEALDELPALLELPADVLPLVELLPDELLPVKLPEDVLLLPEEVSSALTV